MTRRERMEARLARREEWAAKAKAAADAKFAAAHRIVEGIPLGQPILVGHHSEKRHRAAIDRMARNMDAGCERSDMARTHESKAAGIEHQLATSIYSDDDDAIPALEAKITRLEAERARMREVNRLYRKGDASGLTALGLDLEKLRAQVASVGLSFVKAPFESYQLSNIGGRISQAKKRLDWVKEQQQRAEAAQESTAGVVIEGDTWVRVTFAEKPAREILDALKAAGFRWGGGSWCGPREKLPPTVTP